ncbi:hypothetical protein A3Q56_00370 [Intoshia linei]|uniref:Uncharacterized protein n=1 Tax=Intoshia linei TaxID=1819745 RepID=A0A177BE72_9BILA|nr:hypothetical protein A3Q56_00370 [Intoshia linei]
MTFENDIMFLANQTESDRFTAPKELKHGDLHKMFYTTKNHFNLNTRKKFKKPSPPKDRESI